MSKILIDAKYTEETRIVLLEDSQIIKLDCITKNKKSIKGNIYLSKVINVEPSIQAAFLDYGTKRNGFLAYQDDNLLPDEVNEDYHKINMSKDIPHKNQYLLVQVIKDERFNKGAVFSPFISLTGVYCILIINVPATHIGISKKIIDSVERKRLKEVIQSFVLPKNVSVIVRTSCQNIEAQKIEKDIQYLLGLWGKIERKAKKLKQPCIVHEEGDIFKRTIRDIYSKNIEKILIQGKDAYNIIKKSLKTLFPEGIEKIELYPDKGIPLFHKFNIENKIQQILNPEIKLPSGGRIKIQQTEALTSVDVNSAKSIKEMNLEETAFNTNMEAIYEIIRQTYLRNLSGIIVIDLIDMYKKEHIEAVQTLLKKLIKLDKARIQIGKINEFGLLTFSRQRLQNNLEEIFTEKCSCCEGYGFKKTLGSKALSMLRELEKNIAKEKLSELHIELSEEIYKYIINKKHYLNELQDKYNVKIIINPNKNQKNYKFIETNSDNQKKRKVISFCQ